MALTGACDFPAAILKGIIEHGDATRYFGSLGGFSYYKEQAQARKLIDADAAPTETGLDYYISRGLWLLPDSGRAYMWRWDELEDE